MYASILLHFLPLFIFFAATSFVFLRYRRPTTKDPPGRFGLPLIGETLAFLVASNSSKGFYDFVQSRRERYGKCFKTSLFCKRQVFVASVEAAKVVLGGDFVSFTKGYMRSIGELVGEQSLLCATQQHHRFIRHRLSELFTVDSISLFIKQFDQMTMVTLEEWDSKPNLIVLTDTLKITFNAICKMVMSLEDPHELELLRKDVAQVCDAMLAFPLKLPRTKFHKGLEARKRFMKTIRKILAERRRGAPSVHQDFLHYLLQDDNECSHEYQLTDKQIEDNILTLIIAGQITTASAMTWMVKYLDENKDVQEKLRETQIALVDKATSLPLSLEQLNEMTYASKVVKESLRLASVVSWFPRIALQDCQIEGFDIKKGWVVNVDSRFIHYDPNVYDNPTKFQPLRFNDDPKPYSFLVFGTGGRTCLGMNLAKTMMLIFLHRLVTTYRWEVIDKDSSLEEGALFPRLRSGCPIRVERVQLPNINRIEQLGHWTL